MEFARRAWTRMQELGLSPTPENYELWFVYYSQAEPELCREIKALENQKSAITDERCYELYKKFLKGGRDGEAVRSAGDKIKETIGSVNSAVSGARAFAHEYNASLEKINLELRDEEKSKEEINELLSDLLTDTQTMMDQNSYFEQLLKESADTMEELQKDLEIARKEAMTDPLTGLSNRKAFDHEVENMVRAVQQDGEEVFVLLMIDIDHFKRFNDTYGHQLGDQILKLVARTLQDGIKGRDIAVRYGGEEFAIILPETKLFGGLKVAEQLRMDVGGKDVINRMTGERLTRVTLSAGVAEFDPDESIESVISRADAALYAAKENGRNQVAAASRYVRTKQDSYLI